MHCREFEDRLRAILDDRRTPQRDPRLRDHAARCESCRQLLTDQAALAAAFSLRQAPQPRGDFARRVVLAATAAIIESIITDQVIDSSVANTRPR